MFRILLLVGLGSGAGGALRYFLQQQIYKSHPSSFPWGTLIVNITGCFIIGVIYALSDKGNILSPSARILLIAGFCGGYTTFSSFAYENISMLREGELLYFFLYTAASIVIGLAATYAGIFLIKTL